MSGVSTELDPLFLKALGYFWSKSPDSTAKLKKLLDDVIEQSQKKKQDVKPIFDSGKSSAIKVTKHSLKTERSKSGLIHDPKKKEKEIAQKRQFEKIQKDLEELDQEVSKKTRFDRSSSPASAFLSGDVKPSPKQLGLSDALQAQRNSPLSSDDKDFALEMDELACVVCNAVSSSQGNTPVECQECHNMYHRECHQPSISYQDANDPRCVWYCARCTKNMKKVAKQSSSKTSNGVSAAATVRERLNSMESKNKSAFVTPFKRNELKPSLQSSGCSLGGGGGSLSGWAALSGKNIQPASASSKTAVKPSVFGQTKPMPPAAAPMKEKKEKTAKPSKSGPKLAVSDAWAEALGADLPAAPSGGSKASSKSSLKSTPSWGSSKSGVFPKAAATSVPSGSASKTMTNEAASMKKIQMMKKKAKMNPKKSKM